MADRQHLTPSNHIEVGSSSTNAHPRHPSLLTLAQIAEAMESPPQSPTMQFRAQTDFFGPPSGKSVSHLNQKPNLNLSLGESSSFSSYQPRDQTYIATYQYLQQFGQQSTIPQLAVYTPGFTRSFSSPNASQVRPPSTPSCAVVLNSFGQPVLERNSDFRSYLSPLEQNPTMVSTSVRVAHCQNPPPYNNPGFDPNMPRFASNQNPQRAKRFRIDELVVEEIQESTRNNENPTPKCAHQAQKGKKKITGLSEDLSEKLDFIIAYLRRTHDENVRWLRYEKSRDDMIRAVWSKEHPVLVRQLPPFPIDLLWVTPPQHPTSHK